MATNLRPVESRLARGAESLAGAHEDADADAARHYAECAK